MTIAKMKQQLRKEMLAKRAKLDVEIKRRYDDWICGKIWEIILLRGVRHIHCYLPMGAEVNIFPLIEKMLNENLTVVCPKTLPKPEMEHLILNALEELEQGVFGTSHPANTEVFSADYDLIIVPGLAFDEDYFRLGYGGGYYDHFLAQHPKAHKLGLGYPFQKVKAVPLECHDVRLDEVLFGADLLE